MPIDRTTLGPVEILVVGFPGNQFTGEIVPALRDLVQQEIIRILGLAFVSKAEDGTVTVLELGELDEDARLVYGDLGAVEESLVGDEDLADVARDLAPGNSAAILIWEDRWAAPFADAIRNAGAQILALERVPREAVDGMLDALSS